MTGDKRQTWGLIIDVLDVYERHGYKRGDRRHIGRAVSVIGEIGRIYEGTQDAPAGMHIGEPPPVPMAAEPGPVPPGADAAAIADDDRRTILAALDEAAEYKRDRAAACAQCTGQSCGTCQYRLQMATAYDHVAGRLTGDRQASSPGVLARGEPDTATRRDTATDRERALEREAAAELEAGR